MKIFATITQGFVLRDTQSLTRESIDEIAEKVERNELSAEELLALGFEEVHFEGVAWEEGE